MFKNKLAVGLLSVLAIMLVATASYAATNHQPTKSINPAYASSSVDNGKALFKDKTVSAKPEKSAKSSSTSSDVGFIGVNDYLIVNKDIVASSINWSDVDVIRDPKNEAIDILREYSGGNPYLLMLKRDVIVKGDVKSLNAFKIEYEPPKESSQYDLIFSKAGAENTYITF